MLFRVKANARYADYTALGGLVFTKKSVTVVPDEKVEDAKKLDFLEMVDVEKVAEKLVSEEQAADAEKDTEPVDPVEKPKRRSAKKEG